MTEKTELTAEEQAEFDKLEAAEKAKAEGKPGRKAKGEGTTKRVLEKKAFINGRLYEPGETVDEDADGNFLAVPKSKPAGDLSVDELKQLLAKAEAAKRAAV